MIYEINKYFEFGQERHELLKRVMNYKYPEQKVKDRIKKIQEEKTQIKWTSVTGDPNKKEKKKDPRKEKEFNMEVELMMFVNGVQKKVGTRWEKNPFEEYA